MKRVAGEAISGFFDALHRSRGVDIRLGARLAAIEGDTRATGVALASGERIAADLVLVATGARANDDLAAARRAWRARTASSSTNSPAPRRTSMPSAIARASSRSAMAARSDSNACRTPSIRPSAAADAIMGKPKPYDPVPWFWSDQYEIKLQITGLLDGFDACRDDRQSGRRKILGRVPQRRQADRGRCGQRRPRPHAGAAPDRGGFAGGFGIGALIPARRY